MLSRVFFSMTFLVVGAFVGGSVNAQDWDQGHWIDLTHSYSEETIYWPTSAPFEKTTVFEGQTEGGYYYSAYNIKTAEHGGTHLDAPIHFSEGRQSVEAIPLENLIGTGVLIDVATAVEKDRGYQIAKEDILAWEKVHGPLPEGAIVLFRTGMGRFWPDKKKYMGTDKLGPEGVAALSFPGIHPDTARFLATKRRIKAVGIDTPSIDHGQSKLYETHQILFEKNIPGFENVANLDRLPATGFRIIALPMKIEGGSGAPLRIVAFLPK